MLQSARKRVSMTIGSRALGRIVFVAAALLAVGGTWLRAQTAPASAQLAYQGYLEHNGASASHTVTLTFSLCSDGGTGACNWSETQSGVAVLSGRFAVDLGSVGPTPLTATILKNNPYLAIEVVADDDPQAGLLPVTLEGRQKLAASPYAWRGAPGQNFMVDGEVSSSSVSVGQFRAVAGNYGSFLRNDGSDTYLLLTASGDPYGSWNGLRPFRFNNVSGDVAMNHNVTIGGDTSLGGVIKQDMAGANYDVWLQGGASTAGGNARNLALLGVTSSDTLVVNYNNEYAGGVAIQSNASVGGNITANNVGDCFVRRGSGTPNSLCSGRGTTTAWAYANPGAANVNSSVFNYGFDAYAGNPKIVWCCL